MVTEYKGSEMVPGCINFGVCNCTLEVAGVAGAKEIGGPYYDRLRGSGTGYGHL